MKRRNDVKVRAWARYALDGARKCGRVEEVESALRHAIRDHRQLRSAAALEATLDDWKAQRSSGLPESER